MIQQQKPAQWTPAWVAIVAAAVAVVAVIAVQAGAPLSSWGFPMFGAAGAAGGILWGLTGGLLLRTHIARTLGWLAVGGWVWWALWEGWTDRVWLGLVGGTLVLAGLLHYCQTPERPAADPSEDDTPRDRRPAEVREWERLLRARLRGAKLAVTDVVAWPNPDDGEWVYVDLPDDGSVEPEQVVNACRGIAIAKHLPNGCTIGVLNGEHQGQVILDVMLQATSGDTVGADADYSPASVYDEFSVMNTPRGDPLPVCLREDSMIVGGAPKTGKTTLLHRIILFLARCVDCIIWVIDTNGGGVATPWLVAWATRQAGRPIIDWVADTDEEAAVLIAVANAVVTDRKTSPEATRRKKAADDNVLPVDANLSMLIVINDEGGQVRQAVSALGQIADAGMSKLAQIGRNEGGRLIKCVLRGTSDLLDKGARVVASIRMCLRLIEADEYSHILDGSPPKGVQLAPRGDGWLRRLDVDPRPIRARTVDMLPSEIEEASIACAGLRPDLDDRARKVAARLTVRDVLGGRDPTGYPDLLKLRVMQDVAAGRAYEGRWERFAPRLAAIRGEDLPEPEPVDETPAGPAPTPAASSVAPEGSALARLLAATGVTPQLAAQPVAVQPERAAVDVTDQENVDREFARLTADMPMTKLTTREHIVAILQDGPLASGEIGERLLARGAAVRRTYRQDVLAKMLKAGEIMQGEDGRYGVPNGDSDG